MANRHGVERELRKRGIDERHSAWERALRIVGPALRNMTAAVPQEAAARVSKAVHQIDALPAD